MKAEIDFPTPWLDTASELSALFHILSFLRIEGVLENKNAPLLVARNADTALLQLIRKQATPTRDATAAPRAALLNHQYGYPQNMDEVLDYAERKKIIILEDCSDSFESYYRGRRLGTFGRAAIFGFSKVFSGLQGGGLATSDQKIFARAQSERERVNAKWIAAAARFVNMRRQKAETSDPLGTLGTMLDGVAEYAQKMSTPAKREVLRRLKADVLNQRRRSYSHLRSRLESTGYLATLEKDGVTPSVVPLIAPPERLDKVVRSLAEGGYVFRRSSFDIHRNIFNPKFVACIELPVQPSVAPAELDRICEFVVKA